MGTIVEWGKGTNSTKVKQTMANIKFVLWERKLAVKKAENIVEKRAKMESRRESSVPFVDSDIEMSVVKELERLALKTVPDRYNKPSLNPRRRKNIDELVAERLERARPKGAILIDVAKQVEKLTK